MPFGIAVVAGASKLLASREVSGSTTVGSVYGFVQGRLLVPTPTDEAGLTTIDGREVLVVRFSAQGESWEIRFRRTFWPLATAEVCGPAGCESGLGLSLRG